MAQEIDKAIPVLEQAAKMSKDGDTYVSWAIFICLKIEWKIQSEPLKMD